MEEIKLFEELLIRDVLLILSSEKASYTLLKKIIEESHGYEVERKMLHAVLEYLIEQGVIEKKYNKGEKMISTLYYEKKEK